MATSCRRSSGPVLPLPGGRCSSLSGSLRSGDFASSFRSAPTGAFSASPSSDFEWHPHHRRRAASPTRVHLAGSSKAPAVRFSLGRRPASPVVDGMGVSSSPVRSPAPPARRTCMCSPTNHPGSFRCSLHKQLVGGGAAATSSTSMRLNMRRSAMTNSLVRIGTVEGDLVKRALAALIRPSSHQQRRRAVFQPRPSRLSVMSKAEDTHRGMCRLTVSDLR